MKNRAAKPKVTAPTKRKQKLIDNEMARQLMASFENTTDYIFIIDIDGYIHYWNSAAIKLFGVKNKQQSLNIEKCYSERSRQLLINEGLAIAIRDGIWQQDMELLTSNGCEVPVSQVMLLHKNSDSEVKYFSITARDISELKNAEHALQIYARIFESTQEGIMITDPNQNIVQVNKAFIDTTGYTAADVIGKNPRLLQSGRHDAEFYKSLWKKLDSHGQWQGEIWNRRKNGEIYPEWLNISAIKDEHGVIINYVGIFSDITTIKSSEKLFAHMAQHDALTNLPNRILFHDRLKVALTKATRNNSMVAVLYLDLDHFKPVNDRLGHNIGDLLLQAVAERLSNCVREGDTVARIGGDEFSIILDPIINREDAVRVAQKILHLIAQPFKLEGHQVSVGVSVGISLFPFDGKDSETLINTADQAMYYSKKHQGNTYRFA